jgi:hypothetical protein
MGWAARLTSIITTVTRVGRAIVGVIAPIAKVIVKSAKDFVDGVFTGFSEGIRDEPKSAQEKFERELQEVNAKIMTLRKLSLGRGEPTKEQRQEWATLKEQRNALNKEISALDQVLATKEIVEEEKNYQPIIITDANAQVLQYHVGQSTHNKLCQCGRSMVLQWDRRTSTAGLHDFFWGCSGYYVELNGRRACQKTQQLTFADLNLFANLNRPEFEIASLTLTRETINPVKANRIRQALDGIRDSQKSKRLGITTYRCPIHGESLRLQRKNQAAGQLLDEYFLGCPRWLPDNKGCNFLVKLKSAAQISSVLDTEYKKGVLSV